jgi:hypothetical protein
LAAKQETRDQVKGLAMIMPRNSSGTGPSLALRSLARSSLPTRRADQRVVRAQLDAGRQPQERALLDRAAGGAIAAQRRIAHVRRDEQQHRRGGGGAGSDERDAEIDRRHVHAAKHRSS